MKYLLIISHDDDFEPTGTLIEDIGSWVAEMERREVRIQGNPLRPSSEARTVRIRDGELQITEGPFAQTNEKMCAYDLIESPSIEDAIDIASRHPMAKAATIEVRPVWSELAT